MDDDEKIQKVYDAEAIINHGPAGNLAAYDQLRALFNEEVAQNRQFMQVMEIVTDWGCGNIGDVKMYDRLKSLFSKTS